MARTYTRREDNLQTLINISVNTAKMEEPMLENERQVYQ